MVNDPREQRPDRTLPILMAVGVEIIVLTMTVVPIVLILSREEVGPAAVAIAALYALFGAGVTAGVAAVLMRHLRHQNRRPPEKPDAPRE